MIWCASGVDIVFSDAFSTDFSLIAPQKTARARMSRRAAVSPERRPWSLDPKGTDGPSVSCPVCGVDLTSFSVHKRETHADECAHELSQLDLETHEEDGDDEIDEKNVFDVDDARETIKIRARELEEAHARRLASGTTTSGDASRAIRPTETIEMWLERIGMLAYFCPLFVEEDLLDVDVAKECSAEDFVFVGVAEEDARILAHCGGPAPEWLTPKTISDVNASRPRTRARAAMELALATSAANDERLWDVARGADGRGRGESLPALSRLLPRRNT